MAFAISNIAAQIVAFFVNKEKTFNSGANTKVVLPIYIVFTIALICFSQWLNPTIYGWILNDIGWGDAAARNIATACCSVLQFVLYFPVDKILFHKKKEETPADNKDGKKAQPFVCAPQKNKKGLLPFAQTEKQKNKTWTVTHKWMQQKSIYVRQSFFI